MSSATPGSASVRESTRDKSGILYLCQDGIKRVSNRFVGQPVHDVEEDEVAFLGASPDFSNSLPELPTPASGDAYDDCGEEQPLQFCGRCGEPYYVPRRCRRSRCPECWESWDKQRAVSIAAKIQGRLAFEAAKFKNIHGDSWGGDGLKQHHLTLSPPQDGFWFRSDKPVQKAREIAKILLGEMGADEGVLIYHPWRIAEEHRGAVMGHESGDGDLTWKDVIGLIEEEGFESVREEYLVHEPHFHAIVLSRYITGAEHIYEKSGWVTHRITKSDSNVSIENKFDLCKVAGYCLSHAGLRETESGRTEAVYSYFGEVADFEASAGIRADIENCFNRIADTILGVSFTNSRCTSTVDGVENGVESTDTELPASVELEYDEDECGGKRKRMQKAPEYLDDESWCAGAPCVDDLREAYAEYRAIEAAADRPPPAPPPDE